MAMPDNVSLSASKLHARIIRFVFCASARDAQWRAVTHGVQQPNAVLTISIITNRYHRIIASNIVSASSIIANVAKCYAGWLVTP